MTREEASRYGWVGLLGLATTLISSFGGVAIAGHIARDDDDALVSGLVWGTLVGMAIGGAAVGRAVAQTSAGGAGRLIAWVISPGVLVGAPMLASGMLTGEATILLLPVAGMIILSGTAAGLAGWDLRADLLEVDRERS